MRIWTSIKLIILGAVLLAAGLAIGAFWRFLSPEHLRQMLLAGFGRSVNATLEVQAVNMDQPGTVRIINVKLSAPSGGPPVFTCPQIEVELQPASLLKGKAVPRRVSLLSPTVRLAYSVEKRAWNIASIKGHGRGAARRPACCSRASAWRMRR